jgi:hypothetical protein
MQASEVPRAVAAAMSTVSSLDLTVEDAIVLHDSNKLTLRLLPCDVLARVAPVAHQVAQFEVELAQRLAESGCPVAALEPRVDPRVYERDGFVVTLWTYYEPATPREVSPADQDLLRECRILVLAMIATWRWDRGDQLPNGRRLGTEWLSQIPGSARSQGAGYLMRFSRQE